MRLSPAARIYFPRQYQKCLVVGCPLATVSTNPQWSRRDPRCRRRLQRAGGGCRSPLVRSTQRLKPGAGRKGTERPWRDGNVRITPPPGVSFALLSHHAVGRPGLPELPSTEAAAAGSSLTTREAGALPRQPLQSSGGLSIQVSYFSCASFPGFNRTRPQAQLTSSVPGHCSW